MFKKRSKPRAGPSGSTPQANGTDVSSVQPRRKTAEDRDDEEEEDTTVGTSVVAGASGAVRRTVGLQGRASIGGARRGESRKISDDNSFAVRRNVIARDYSTTSLPLHLQQQASIRSEGDGEASNNISSYSPSALAELKAATPSRSVVVDETTSTNKHDRVREIYDTEFSHDAIPSETVINAAKERRRREAANAAQAQRQTDSDDFISLHDRGPHPDSRLQREEDEEGSGEEEFSQFTGATERVALHEKGKENERQRERQERVEAMEYAMDNESDDESEREWERAQLERASGAFGSVNNREQRHRTREQSPFKPVPIPLTAPLPSVSSTSVRLQQRLGSVESSIAGQQQLLSDAMNKLEQLSQDEERNKVATEAAAECEAWFREFDEFIQSMALFLEKKVPLLQDIETDWAGHLAVRTRLVQKARADALTDQLSLFYGVPSFSLYAPPSRGEELDEYDPTNDGDALSEARQKRRAYSSISLSGQMTSADHAAYEVARREILQRAAQLLDDVHADEFRDPAARVNVRRETEEGEGEGELMESTITRLHPSSLVARFHRWRRLYATEYNNAWGGLTLASVWDFWIRRSLCGWDVGYVRDQQPNSVDGFTWYMDLAHYTQMSHRRDDDDTRHDDYVGGDDEVVAHAFTNSVIPFLIKMCERGAFDAWNSQENASLLDLLEQISYVLEKDNARFQSLISTILGLFERQINVLVQALNNAPALPAPAISPDGPPTLLECTEYVYGSLVRNVLAWRRNVSAAQKPFWAQMTERLISKALFTLFDMAIYVEGGRDVVHRLANDLVARTARMQELGEDVRSQLSHYATDKRV